MCKFCWTLLLLLLLAIGGVVYKFGFLGSVEQAPDGRQALLLTVEERNLVLGEMRAFLVAVQQIIAATNREDMEAAAKAAHKVGMAAQGAVPPGLIGKLPMEFKKLGFSTHKKFDELSLDAAQLGDPQHTREQLAVLMNNCIACHATYSLSPTH
ncbi:hypothetical protein [Thiolapillus brandeum]|uniref:Cytochrome c n=1 Tax=Thiolapillus brandeum TaxID=1076588 RepID=A0A7U6GL97_9GAMM|nr:hypothetical protein [Thiolapillus brandeum]BAO45695.1 conserved hypothetical protein [Thiolapillus brandeum]